MSVVLHDGRIVGADYRTRISHDGAAVVSHGGLRPTSDREWNKIWDGYHFAQPPAGCLLYLPGHPGQGSTIYDYSYNFNDSGINTNEEAAQGETEIDCDADATAAIPAGSIVRIEDEYMYVTGTGVAITVVRGYLNSVDVLHDTNKDIIVWIPRNGTITGATWNQLPSGASYLQFNGTDVHKVECGVDIITQADIAGGASMLLWANIDTVDDDHQEIFSVESRLLLQVEATTDKFKFQIYDGAEKKVVGNAAISTGRPYLVVGTWDTTNMLIYQDGVVQTDTRTSNIPTIDGVSRQVGLGIQHFANGLKTDGGLALARITNAALSAADVATIWNQERHLFNV